MELTQEIKDLFKVVRVKLGAPIRPIQLSDDQLCGLQKLLLVIMLKKFKNWIIQSNWLNFSRQNKYNG